MLFLNKEKMLFDKFLGEYMMTYANIIEAFEFMWGNFPEPVMLVHKTREILAVNKACRNTGRVVGKKCSSIGSSEKHKRCLADTALESNRAAFSKSEVRGKTIISYWVPVSGYTDIYIHFSVRV